MVVTMSDDDLRFIQIKKPGNPDADPVGTVSNTYIGKAVDEIELRPGMELSLSSQIAPDGHTIKIEEMDDE